MSLIDAIVQRWQVVVVPAAVFVAFLLFALWLRRLAYRAMERWAKQTQWEGHSILVAATRLPSLLASLIIAVLLALEVSILADGGKALAARVSWSLFALMVALAALGLARGLLRLYLERFNASPRVVSLSSNIATVTAIVVSLLTILELWGVPTGPVALLIGIGALALLFAFRDAMSSLFAWFHLSASGKIKVGDYIKVESGEEGYVTEFGWRATELEGLDGSTVIIPNHKLTQSRISNYGRPLKQAAEPFRFYSRLHLKELTNLKARTLRDLVATLKTAPDAVVYYHTHNFLEEHHYLTPEPANDFAVWVTDALGNEALGERLASLDTFEFSTLALLRDRVVDIIEEYLARNPDSREALPGREFHFIRSVSIVLPLQYVAHDLREFVEVLRNVSVGSLFFHVFESRLRIGKGFNDFSVWIEESLGEPELAAAIAQLDPYNYSLEGLRSSLIQLIEKHVK
ncbi:MAG: mechanosensitive ion channel [Chloroflexi bacterium]|nr:mechanosensitive ion channel [Chloroflexota bacterium]